MVRYKNQTHKSNYLKLEAEAGINYQSEDGAISLHSGICTLSLVLTPGEHVVSGRYEAGVVDGEPVMGEMILHYCMNAGKFVICDYNFEQKLDYETPEYYKCPEFRLVKIKKDTDGFEKQEEEVLLQVSARYEKEYTCTLGKEMGWPVRDCRKLLRKVYEKIDRVLAKAQIPVYKRLEEIPQYDECGRIVGGDYVTLTTMQAATTFYNMINTSGDRPRGGGSWLDYYANHAQQNRNKCCARNVGAPCTAATVPLPSRYKGAHIGFAANVSVPMTPMVQGNPKFLQNFQYHLLPLCTSHNNQGGNFIMTCTPSDGVIPVNVLVLDHFRHTKVW